MFRIAGQPSDLGANARLIAAAHDLRDALKDMIQHPNTAAALSKGIRALALSEGH
jgi:hypothetical protein